MRRNVVVLAMVVLVIVALMCAASPAPATRAQIDPTILARQSELAATVQANAHATATRRSQVEQLSDAATRVSLELTASAATAVYWAGQTSTPIAAAATAQHYANQTATVQSAQVTRAFTETATIVAQATATAKIVETQSAQQTATVVAATATADAVAFSERVRRQEELDRVQAENRQRVINQVRQAVYVLGGLVLVSITPIIGWLVYRRIAGARTQAEVRSAPIASSVLIDESGREVDESRPMTEAEIESVVDRKDAPTPIVTTDQDIVRKWYEKLDDMGVLDNGVTSGGEA